jgi:hypothetical protein
MAIKKKLRHCVPNDYNPGATGSTATTAATAGIHSARRGCTPVAWMHWLQKCAISTTTNSTQAAILTKIIQ